MSRRLVWLPALVILGCLCSPAYAKAAPASTPDGITVSPVLQQLQLQKNQQSSQFTVQVTNNTKDDVSVDLDATNFKADGVNGGLSFLQDNDADTITHGLASNMTFSPNHVDLPPKAAQKIIVTIQNAAQLAPGGHYGAVLYHILNTDATTVKNGNVVSLQHALSTLVFATTEGQGTKGIQLDAPRLNKLTFHFPTSINVIIRASGNTQITPRGTLIVTADDLSKAPASIINPSSGMILPGSNRLFTTAVPPSHISWWPAVYHLRINYRYDGQSVSKTYVSSFLYINVWHILLTILSIAFIVWILIKLRRYYKQLRRRGRLTLLRAKKSPAKTQVPVITEAKTNRTTSKTITVELADSNIHMVDVKTTSKSLPKTSPKQTKSPQKKAQSAPKKRSTKKTSSKSAKAVKRPAKRSKK